MARSPRPTHLSLRLSLRPLRLSLRFLRLRSGRARRGAARTGEPGCCHDRDRGRSGGRRDRWAGHMGSVAEPSTVAAGRARGGSLNHQFGCIPLVRPGDGTSARQVHDHARPQGDRLDPRHRHVVPRHGARPRHRVPIPRGGSAGRQAIRRVRHHRRDYPHPAHLGGALAGAVERKPQDRPRRCGPHGPQQLGRIVAGQPKVRGWGVCRGAFERYQRAHIQGDPGPRGFRIQRRTICRRCSPRNPAHEPFADLDDEKAFELPGLIGHLMRKLAHESTPIPASEEIERSSGQVLPEAGGLVSD